MSNTKTKQNTTPVNAEVRMPKFRDSISIAIMHREPTNCKIIECCMTVLSINLQIQIVSWSPMDFPQKISVEDLITAKRFWWGHISDERMIVSYLLSKYSSEQEFTFMVLKPENLEKKLQIIAFLNAHSTWVRECIISEERRHLEDYNEMIREQNEDYYADLL